MSRTRVMGALRLAVGIGMIAAPRAMTGQTDATSVLLLRTIGVRDLVLGAGTLVGAGQPAGRLFTLAGLASDSLDVVTGAVATPSLGRSGLIATFLPVPFVLGDLWALQES